MAAQDKVTVAPVYKPADRRDKVGRSVEVVGSGVAGSVGATLGLARLREAYKAEHKKDFRRATKGVKRVAGKSVARHLAHGEPGFVPLAVGTAAGATAAAAHHYNAHRARRAARIAAAHHKSQTLTDPVAKADAYTVQVIGGNAADATGQLGGGSLRRIDAADATVRRAQSKLAHHALRLGARGARRAAQAGQAVGQRAVDAAQDQLAKAHSLS